jgi:ketosteroid isomerase-like protein
MRAALFTTVVGAAAMAGCIWSTAASAAAADEAEIKALEARFAAAFNAKDIDAIMKIYVPGKSLVVFDVVPPRQYVGSEAYRKDWGNFFAMFKGPVKFDISDLAIETAAGPSPTATISSILSARTRKASQSTRRCG